MKKTGDLKREMILKAAVLAAEEVGYTRMTKEDVAAWDDRLSPSTVQYYFRTVNDLREWAVRQAVADENLAVIAQALGNNSALALRAPLTVKLKAVDLIRKRAGITGMLKVDEVRDFAMTEPHDNGS